MALLAPAYPLALLCEVVGCARSRDDDREQREDDTALQAAIKEVAAAWPTYGYRRVPAQLPRQGWPVNHQRVGRLMGELGLRRARQARARKTTQRQHSFPRDLNLVEGLALMRPDQVWVADITSIRWRNGFVSLAVIMEVLTRAMRGWQLGRALDQSLTRRAWQRALAQHPPKSHHTDQGVQCAAAAYTERLEHAGVQISMAEVGEAWQNGSAERLRRTMKEAEVQWAESMDDADVLCQGGRFLHQVYMHQRIHSALGDLTPAEFEDQWHRVHVQIQDVH
jgi:putative transposase